MSAQWYEALFECTRTHGGNEFAVLENESNEVLICLHKWGAHEHPTMKNPNTTPGNGLILYFKTNNLQGILKNVKKMDYPVEKDISLNPNSGKMEFSIRDPDGYYISITEYHNYKD